MDKENGNHELPTFEEETLWTKIKKVARRAGRELLVLVLTLYYCLKDDDTPIWVKGVIISALVYFISPIDAIPDVIPVIGFSDDLSVLIGASATVARYIKYEHRRRANEWVDNLFGKEDNSDSD